MPAEEQDNLQDLEARIGYRFADLSLLEQSLTHSSYANERASDVRTSDYERLEYLGDAVLELVVSDFLFRRFSELPEGVLTRHRAVLVCEDALYNCAKTFDLPRDIRLGRGEVVTGGREKKSIVSDVVEALIGALYLDGGMPQASAFIHRFVLADVDAKLSEEDDYKSRLQEYVQRAGREELTYRLVHEEGPEHAKVFTTAAYLGGRFLAEGTGKNKKASQQEAAKAALKVLCI